MIGTGRALFAGMMIVGAIAPIMGCAGTASETAAAKSTATSKVAAQPWERDPYTRTSEILIDGAVVGYLVEYQEIPVGVQLERALPAGSYRIQGPRFDDIGFVTPRGDVRRFTPTGSDSLGIWPLEEGLRRFFGKSARAQLRPLPLPAPPKAAPAGDAPKAESGEAAPAGGEKKEGEAGGQ